MQKQMGDTRCKVRDAVLLPEGYIVDASIHARQGPRETVYFSTSPRSPGCMLETQQGKFEWDLSDLSRVIWSISRYVYKCKQDAEDDVQPLTVVQH